LVRRAAYGKVGRVSENSQSTTDLIHPADSPDSPWWRDAVIYQIYPRSWSDSDGDGIGDLPGITAHLPYLRELGVDAIWLSPFYVSPMNDAGYDVADYRNIDPLFGSLHDADTLIETAHALGLRVLIDLVPNHSSSEHEWFKAALAADPGSPERDRYIFRDGQGPNGDLPPNNWPSVFGGRGWSRVSNPDGTPGQWYLHIFDTTQPDYDWTNAEVAAEFRDILRFWLERGADGFRVDVAHGLVKEEGLPDWDGPLHLIDSGVEPDPALTSATETGDDPDTAPATETGDDPDTAPATDTEATAPTHIHETGTGPRPPMWDQDGVHEIYRDWRSVLDEYADKDSGVAGADGDTERILCAEAWVRPLDRLADYTRPDEMHQAFNFEFLDTRWYAGPLKAVIEASLRNNDEVGAPTTWVLSNHDVVRHASRLGLDQRLPRPNGIGAEDAQPDAALGLRRARAATAMMLALPGGAYIYQGEELGLPEHTSMPDEFRQDPTFHRTKGTPELQLGRDGCRVPMPWTKEGPTFGFGPSERTWLPQPEVYGELAVDQQEGVAGSTLELYRDLLHYRRKHRFGHGSLAWDEHCSESVLAFRNGSGDGERTVLVITNFGPDAIDLPEGDVIITSGPLTDDGKIPADTTVWIRIATRP
jgi:alpha-glucosidase